MADHRWQGYSHKELYERIHSGPGPSASFASMERWEGVSAALTEINEDLHKGIALSGAKWSGKAAEMAQSGLNPVAAWADTARTGSDVMRYSAELQAGYISKARADMPAPVAVTAEQPGALVTGLTHLFGGQTDHEKQEAAQDAAERRAREVMSTYASSTTANTSTLGQFTQPPQLQISGTGTVNGGGTQIGTAAVWGFGPHGRGGSATRGRTGSGSRGSATSSPRTTTTTTPGSTTRTSGTAVTPAAAAKGSTSVSSSSSTTSTGLVGTGTGTGIGTGTGTAGVGLPGQRTSGRSDSSKSGSEAKQMEEGATATSSAAVGTVMQQGHVAGVANASGSAMGPMGTVGASNNNDQVHRRAVPMPQAFDPFGGMGGPRKGEEEEDLEHKAADYLRERDDIYGVGSYALPVIGESTTD